MASYLTYRNVLLNNSTVIASTLNAGIVSYSTLTGSTTSTRAATVSTLTGSSITVSTLTGSTIFVSTLSGSTINVSTMTASTILTAGSTISLARNVNVPNRFVEVGCDLANSMYLDFHSSDAALPDYSTRIISQGGATTGTGGLNMYASTIGLVATNGVGIGTTVPAAILNVIEANVNGDVSRKNMFLGLRKGTYAVQNSASMAFALGPNVTTINPYGSLDIKLNGASFSGNNFGDIPDITVMSIIGNGYVGIGTTVPSAALHIKNAISAMRISGNLTDSSARPVRSTTPGAFEIRGSGALDGNDAGFLRLSAGGGTNTNQQSYIDLSASNSVADMDRNIVFGTAGVERMRIGDGGNVGIGTTNPSYALDIPSGKIRTSQLAMVGFTNIVNRRIFWGVGANTSSFNVSINTSTDTSVSLLGGGLAYSPFQYAVPAVATGATRYFRLYVIYGDNMTAGSWNVDFVLSANSYTVTFSLPNTYGGGGIFRDAYSNTIADPTSFYSHGYINIRANTTGKGVNPVTIFINYIELQAIDQY